MYHSQWQKEAALSVVTASAVTGRERSDRVLDAIVVVDDGSQGSLSLEKGVRNHYLRELALGQNYTAQWKHIHEWKQ